jgi:alkanesulfonate monooxygenase SsuD/methylene tetrahydromethanopterin reductase-like flavin-dependent oxidoreductase (luciferase family)
MAHQESRNIDDLQRVDESTPNRVAFAQECEAIVLELVLVGDHMLFHAEPKTQFPAGGAIPDHYAHFPEPFVVLSMARLRPNPLIDTSALLVPEHKPRATAKQIATLNRLSGGRLILGIGTGWLREAADPLGSDFPHRWTQAAEHVTATRELSSGPVASFRGKYVDFDCIVCNPKPTQPSGPPVLIGSADRNALKWIAQ